MVLTPWLHQATKNRESNSPAGGQHRVYHLTHSLMSHKKKTSVLIWHFKGHCCAPIDVTRVTLGADRCWGEWDQSPDCSRGCWSCMFKAIACLCLLSGLQQCTWKNGFGEFPLQSGSAAVYLTGMLMQALNCWPAVMMAASTSGWGHGRWTVRRTRQAFHTSHNHKQSKTKKGVRSNFSH